MAHPAFERDECALAATGQAVSSSAVATVEDGVVVLANDWRGIARFRASAALIR
jgi:hypothetical protein